jgi:diguanylate cyclase (GGDEF)-like protein/PAS domain S-box-containing protein
MRALVGYVAWMLMLSAAYFALPGLSALVLVLVAASAAGAIVVRVARCRPAHKLPWLLLAAAALFVAGSRLTLLAGGARPSLPSWNAYTIVGLPTHALFAVALGLFARARSSGAGRWSLVDAVTVAAGLVMLVWLFRVLPTLTDPALSGTQKLISASYPLGQIAILLALARLLAPGIMWNWPVRLVTAGTVCGLVSGIVFGLLRLHGAHWRIVDLGWIACLALTSAAAVHPAMREMTRHAVPPYETSRARLVVLTVASLIAPLLLILRDHSDEREALIAVSAALLWVFAQVRLWGLNVSQLRTMTWERALTAAGPALASAGSVEEVAAALRTAADTVSGPRSPHAVVFATRISGDLRVLMTSSSKGRGSRLAVTAPRWLPSVLPLLAGRTEGDRATPLYVPAAELESSARIGDLRSGDDGTLLCPIFLSTDPPGDPPAGVLALIGGQRNLEVRWPSVRIMVSEAGLAMERILLTQERVKRESEKLFEELFKELVQDASDAILIINDDDTVRYASPSASAIFGDVPVVGTDMRRLATTIDVEWNPESPSAGAINGRQSDFSEQWRIMRRDRRAVRVRVRHSDLRAKPSVQGRVLTLRDVTEERRLQDELHHRAFHDALTELPNRILFADRAGHALARARRTGMVTAILFLDLDNFKDVNDTLGHATGDELLTAFARRLGTIARESDVAARLSGDEFALLIEDLRAPAEADAIAERAMAVFGEPFSLSAGPVTMTATVGVATSDDSDSIEEMTRHADLALYAAKAAGKHCWQRYSPVLSTGIARRLELRSALEQAVSDSSFELVYQPIVSLDTGRIAGFESLVRWPRPGQDTLMPGQFIDIAENTGLIVPLGAWVIRRALSDLAAGRASADQTSDPFVSINVSARQFRSGNLVKTVREALEDAGLPPSLLLLELTESVLLRHEEGIAANLAEFERLGVRLAVDDFGTGYSSLSYLRELPIDVLKIDKSFVEGITASQQQLALAKGIVAIADTLGIGVVAEGIETAEQCELLTGMGCEYGQGYLLARPMSWQDGQQLLRANRPLTPARRARDATPGAVHWPGPGTVPGPWPVAGAAGGP